MADRLTPCPHGFAVRALCPTCYVPVPAAPAPEAVIANSQSAPRSDSVGPEGRITAPAPEATSFELPPKRNPTRETFGHAAPEATREANAPNLDEEVRRRLRSEPALYTAYTYGRLSLADKLDALESERAAQAREIETLRAALTKIRDDACYRRILEGDLPTCLEDGSDDPCQACIASAALAARAPEATP